MTIAIHHRKGSFSDDWIKYCVENKVSYRLVDAYSTDIIEQLRDCNIFMWHFHHGDHKDMLMARAVLRSVEQMGLTVFPDFDTSWHFDNKVAQKYLLESCGAPLIPSHVFYSKKSALKWVREVDFPKVFKLKGGAGAINVKLVKSDTEACRVIDKAFGAGFPQFDATASLKDKWGKFAKGQATLKDLGKSLIRLFVSTEFSRMHGREKGYVYFQDFIPDNDGDFRIIVIGGKYAYGMKRMNRRNDFRASGSSSFVYEGIQEDILKIAFQVSQKLKLQSVAFDFIRGANGSPLIVEMSYGFGTKGSSQCPGYWSDDLKWHAERFEPQFWLLDELIGSS